MTGDKSMEGIRDLYTCSSNVPRSRSFRFLMYFVARIKPICFILIPRSRYLVVFFDFVVMLKDYLSGAGLRLDEYHE